LYCNTRLKQLELLIHKNRIMELIALEKKEWDEIKQDIKIIKDVLESHGKLSPPKKWLTTVQAGEFLSVKIRTIYLYCQKGLLHPHKACGINLFDRAEIEALIEGK
jgi:hypothetical protein